MCLIGDSSIRSSRSFFSNRKDKEVLPDPLPQQPAEVTNDASAEWLIQQIAHRLKTHTTNMRMRTRNLCQPQELRISESLTPSAAATWASPNCKFNRSIWLNDHQSTIYPPASWSLVLYQKMFTTTEHPGVSRQHPFSSCISLSETGLIYSFPNMHSAFF